MINSDVGCGQAGKQVYKAELLLLHMAATQQLIMMKKGETSLQERVSHGRKRRQTVESTQPRLSTKLRMRLESWTIKPAIPLCPRNPQALEAHWPNSWKHWYNVCLPDKVDCHQYQDNGNPLCPTDSFTCSSTH